jgi:hypothetical protein
MSTEKLEWKRCALQEAEYVVVNTKGGNLVGFADRANANAFLKSENLTSPPCAIFKRIYSPKDLEQQCAPTPTPEPAPTHSPEHIVKEPSRWKSFLATTFGNYQWCRRKLGGKWEHWYHICGSSWFHVIEFSRLSHTRPGACHGTPVEEDYTVYPYITLDVDPVTGSEKIVDGESENFYIATTTLTRLSREIYGVYKCKKFGHLFTSAHVKLVPVHLSVRAKSQDRLLMSYTADGHVKYGTQFVEGDFMMACPECGAIHYFGFNPPVAGKLREQVMPRIISRKDCETNNLGHNPMVGMMPEFKPKVEGY